MSNILNQKTKAFCVFNVYLRQNSPSKTNYFKESLEDLKNHKYFNSERPISTYDSKLLCLTLFPSNFSSDIYG